VFAPQLVVNEKIATVEEKDGIVYYKFISLNSSPYP